MLQSYIWTKIVTMYQVKFLRSLARPTWTLDQIFRQVSTYALQCLNTRDYDVIVSLYN